jgi:hypothetical protein
VILALVFIVLILAGNSVLALGLCWLEDVAYRRRQRRLGRECPPW